MAKVKLSDVVDGMDLMSPNFRGFLKSSAGRFPLRKTAIQ